MCTCVCACVYACMRACVCVCVVCVCVCVCVRACVYEIRGYSERISIITSTNGCPRTSSQLLSAESGGFAHLRSCLKLLSLFFAFFSSILSLSFSLASAFSFNCINNTIQSGVHVHTMDKLTEYCLLDKAKTEGGM